VTLKAARQARDEAKAQKAGGIDPVQARKVEKIKAMIPAANTLQATAEEWIALQRPRWSEHHHERERRNLDKDLLPYLGRRNVREIEPIELLTVIRRVEERGALVAAHRVLSTVRGVWLRAPERLKWPSLHPLGSI
jgi:hypothetical protein